MQLLLAALFLLVQDPEPADAFQAFEQKISKAATLSVKVQGRQEVTMGAAAPVSFAYSAELLLKGPRKARFRLQAGKQELLMLSDGTTLQAGSGAALKSKDAPEDLRARFFDPSASRMGLLGVVAVPTGHAGQDVEDRRRAFSCAEFRRLEAEEGHPRIRYRTQVSPSGRSFEVTLSLDAATGLPRKRVIVGQDARSKSVVTETCESFVLDGEISDESFALPRPK